MANRETIWDEIKFTARKLGGLLFDGVVIGVIVWGVLKVLP